MSRVPRPLLLLGGRQRLQFNLAEEYFRAVRLQGNPTLRGADLGGGVYLAAIEADGDLVVPADALAEDDKFIRRAGELWCQIAFLTLELCDDGLAKIVEFHPLLDGGIEPHDSIIVLRLALCRVVEFVVPDSVLPSSRTGQGRGAQGIRH